MSTGVLPPSDELPVTEALESEFFTVPRVPASITREVSSLYNIWQYAVPNPVSETDVTYLPVPKTVVSPSNIVMRNLVPQGTPHPLYEETTEYVELRRNFLLDYFSLEAVDQSDPKINDAEGLSVANLNGNHLLFKTDASGNLTINGIAVEESKLLKDGTWHYVIADLLFNHKLLVEEAFDELLNHTRENGFGDLGSPTGFGIDAKAVPGIPYAVDRDKASSLIHLWRHALRNQESTATFDDLQDPKTVLSVSQTKMLGLIPVDGPNPLYNESSENVALRSEILLDYLISESVSSRDPRMRAPEGLTVTNMNGNQLVFKMDRTGHLKVNGIDATEAETLTDGTRIYNLQGLLFDHAAKMRTAFKELTSLLTKFEPFGKPLVVPSIKVSLVEESTAVLPSIPASVDEGHGSSLVYLWRYALNNQNVVDDEKVPMTVLYPEYKALVHVVPPDALQPLYDDGPESVKFRKEFLLDYLVLEPINLEDPKLSLHHGVVVKNLLGKELVFKKDFEGTMTINGVPVETSLVMSDGVWTYGLRDYLFDHRLRLDQAYDDMYGYESGSDDFAKIGDPFSRSVSPVADGIFPFVATLPSKLMNESSLTMFHLWQRALDLQDARGVPRYSQEIKTILSPPLLKVLALAPFGIPHPLSANDNETNVSLRREIVNDYLIMNFVSPLDNRLANPEGVTYMNLNGKPITFKKLARGNHTIHGEIVILQEGTLSVNDILVDAILSTKGYIIYSIKDFLFDHEERVNQAVEELKGKLKEKYPVGQSGIGAARPRSLSPVPHEETSNRVPGIPKLIEGGKLTKLILLWRHAVDNQDYLLTLNDERVPRTLLSPGFTAMNLVPPGAPHPLFDDRSPENAALRNEIINDYLIMPRVSTSSLHSKDFDVYNVFTVPNLNGKQLNFTRSPSDKYYINGVGVENIMDLPGGTMVYFLEDFLFDHRERVMAAFEKLVQRRLSDSPIDNLLDQSLLPAIKESIPNIPEIVVREQATTMMDIWRIALKNQNPKKSERDDRVPRTIISPEHTLMVNLFPLIDETNAVLRAQFLLDYLSLEAVSFHDLRMDLPGGYTAMNMNGRELIFHRENDSVSINGVPVSRARTLSDGTEIYTIKDLLFEHRTRIDTAFEIMTSQTSELDHGNGGSTEKSSATVSPMEFDFETVPGIPQMVKISQLPAFLHVWQEAVAYQGPTVTENDGRVPKTILSPHQLMLADLLPPGNPNPLLDDSSANVALRIEFLKDYLIMPHINLMDENIGKSEGQNYTNLNGKTVTFSRNLRGELFVNNIAVETTNPLRDGTLVFILRDFLFDHRKQLVEAYQNLIDGTNSQPVSDLYPREDVVQENSTMPRSVPVIPEVVVLGKHSSLLKFWQRALEDQAKLSIPANHNVPRTVLDPSILKLVNLVPDESLHPLLDDSSDNMALRAEILLDYLVLQPLDPQDAGMDTLEGLTVKNLLGKNLVFKWQSSTGARKSRGILSVNGVHVRKVTTLADGTQHFELADLLFDHKERIIEAFNELKRQSNITEQPASTSASEPVSVHEAIVTEPLDVIFHDQPLSEVISEIATADFGQEEIDAPLNPVLMSLPKIPRVMENSRSSLIDLWRYALRHQNSTLFIDERVPMTILTPINDKMRNLVPGHLPHPLYDENPENIAFRTEFLLDYLIVDPISIHDPKISQPGGLIVSNLNGKEMSFSADKEGFLVVNGIPVENIQTLSDGSQMYTLSNFLFNHNFRISKALSRLASHTS